MNFESLLTEISALEKVAEGWRGIVFSGFYNGNKIAIKKAREPKFEHCIKTEIEIIKNLTGFPSIPKLYFTGDGFFAVEFIEGCKLDKHIRYLKEHGKKEDIVKIIVKMADTLFFFDKKGFCKKELKRCTNNIIVDRNSDIYFIDFEKSRFGVYNKNIPQFLQFLKYIGIFDIEKTLKLGKFYNETSDITKIKRHITESIYNMPV